MSGVGGGGPKLTDEERKSAERLAEITDNVVIEQFCKRLLQSSKREANS